MSYLSHPWRCSIAATLFAVASMTARAADCAYTTETPAPLTSISQLGGAITVGRDTPVGTQIYRANYSTTRPTNLRCPAGSYSLIRQYAVSPGTPSGVVDPGRGPVYRTSVPGIGYNVAYGGAGLPYVSPFDFSQPTVIGTNATFNVVFYKIGDVSPGNVRGSDLAPIELFMQGDSRVPIYSGRFAGSLEVVGRTCTTPDLNIDLGEHLTSELSGAGSGTRWVDVPVHLQDCPAYFGAFRSDQTVDNDFSPVVATPNQLGYRVDATTTVIDANRSIMAVKDATAPGSAKGVGIQVANAAEDPVGFGVVRASGITLAALDGSSYTIPLRARYVQVEPQVTAGAADGQATVTFVYQ